MKLLEPANYSDIENNLIFVGLVGLRVSSVILWTFYFILPPFPPWVCGRPSILFGEHNNMTYMNLTGSSS